MAILRAFRRGPGMKILAKAFLQVLVRSSCGDPSDMVSQALRDLVQVLLRSS